MVPWKSWPSTRRTRGGKYPPGVLGFERPHLKFAAVVKLHLAVEELELMCHVRLLAELCCRASLVHLLGAEVDLAAEELVTAAASRVRSGGCDCPVPHETARIHSAACHLGRFGVAVHRVVPVFRPGVPHLFDCFRGALQRKNGVLPVERVHLNDVFPLLEHHMAVGIDVAAGAGEHVPVPVDRPEVVSVEVQLVVDHAGVEEAHELAGPDGAGGRALAEIADVDASGGA
jgi:hypothetical protein